MVKNERRAMISALAAVALWSTVATAFKLGLRELSPVQLLFIATLVSCGIFVVTNTLVGGVWRLPRQAYLHALLMGLINPLAYYTVLFSAYDRLPAQIAQPLNYTWAITLAIIAVPVLGQRLTARVFGGIIVSYVGVLVVISRGGNTDVLNIDATGIVLALGSTLLWALYWLQTARDNNPPLTMMTWSFLFALPAVAVACYLTDGFPAFTTHLWLYGSWVGAIEMGVTFLLWQQAMRLTNHAARISQLIFLSPFVSLFLISEILGEQILPTSVIGLVIIVGGLLISGRPNKGSTPQADPA